MLKKPTYSQVKLRALSIISCLYRADMENDTKGDFQIKFNELETWLVNSSVAMNEFEKKFIFTAHQKIPKKLLIKVSWLEEQAVVFAWALGFIKSLPSYDNQLILTEKNIFDDFEFLSSNFNSTSENIFADEFTDCVTFYESIFIVLGKMLNGLIEADFAKSNLSRSTCDGTGIRILENELAVRGYPLSKVSRKIQTEVHSIAHERYRAFAWLAGIDEQELLDI